MESLQIGSVGAHLSPPTTLCSHSRRHIHCAVSFYGSFLGFHRHRHATARKFAMAIASERIGKSPEWVVERQRALQNVHKLIHLKGPRDKITSVVIPGILAATCLTLLGRGVHNLATGKGMKE